MFHHITVLKEEAVEGLNIKKEGTYVDCTLGGAGHSERIAAQLGPEGLLIGIDQDERALAHAREALTPYEGRFQLVKSNFRSLAKVLNQLQVTAVDGILYDLGVSSPQLDEGERGFSYNHDAPLDMRMDHTQSLTAHEIVNQWDEQQLANIIYRYGEEKFSRRIATRIVQERTKQMIHSTFQLVEIIKQAIPAPARRTGPHPAKRTFQALRIAVNDELRAFEDSLQEALEVLCNDGRLVVITFHSLEDRICKQFFQEASRGCTCPPDFPQCVCENKQKLKIITRKPIIPTEEEIESNPRARSAKLRIAQKL
jgi:16S rRNA (cytosine1402-N4)-methyltransferase